MSCRPSRRWPVLACGLALAAAAACGHRGSPVPPAPSLPVAPRAPQFRQRGDLLEIAASYTVERLGTRRLRPPAAPALLHLVPRNPGDLAGWDTPAREREFARGAAELGLPPFEPAAHGKTVPRIDAVAIERLGAPRVNPSRKPVRPLPDAAPAAPADPASASKPAAEPPAAFVVALALRDQLGRSLPSARAVFRPLRPPLPALDGFAVRPEENGIRLAWAPPADARATKVAVWRHAAGQAEPWSPWRVVDAADGGLFDESARYGEDLVYAAATLRDPGAPNSGDVPAQSEPSRSGTIAYRDVFPPVPPSDVDAVAGSGHVRVLWFPGGSADEARARVERQVEGSEAWETVATIDAPESYAIDRGVTTALRYRYRVTVEDRAGNAAAAVGPTDWVAPRPAEPPGPGAEPDPPPGAGAAADGDPGSAG